MKVRSLIASVAAAGALLAGGLFALRAQEGMPPPAKPGPEHAVLKELAGDWDAAFSMADPQTGKPMTSVARYTTKLALNGLWLLGDYRGEFMDAPFEGHSITGYDQAKKEYVGLWIDSMDTKLEPSRGSYDAAKKELVMHQKGTNPMTQKEVTMTMVTRVVDASTHTFHMMMSGPDGQDMEMFTIKYTRRK